MTGFKKAALLLAFFALIGIFLTVIGVAICAAIKRPLELDPVYGLLIGMACLYYYLVWNRKRKRRKETAEQSSQQ